MRAGITNEILLARDFNGSAWFAVFNRNQRVPLVSHRSNSSESHRGHHYSDRGRLPERKLWSRHAARGRSFPSPYPDARQRSDHRAIYRRGRTRGANQGTDALRGARRKHRDRPATWRQGRVSSCFESAASVRDSNPRAPLILLRSFTEAETP